MLDIKSELNIKLEKMFKKLAISFIFDAIFYIFWCIFTSRILKFIQNKKLYFRNLETNDIIV